jgi:hypothetical protein
MSSNAKKDDRNFGSNKAAFFMTMLLHTWHSMSRSLLGKTTLHLLYNHPAALLSPANFPFLKLKVSLNGC